LRASLESRGVVAELTARARAELFRCLDHRPRILRASTDDGGTGIAGDFFDDLAPTSQAGETDTLNQL
ncbi:hypothetical protein HK405_002022, partial [Cladochytrium tenue]